MKPMLLLALSILAWCIQVEAGLIRKVLAHIRRDTDHLEEIEAEKEAERIAYENSKKYFHEPASHEVGADDLLGHYDTRFFHGKVSFGEKKETQVHMIRAYLNTFREHGLETWLAHGTLLGWWWNGNMLPWDWDIDTQVSEATLLYLGDVMNNTYYRYTSASQDHPSKYVNRTYLLDINPYSVERVNGDGFNIIDARWIDTSNGLYIDITGLSELEPKTEPGVVSCKNYHSYRLKDLYPLRETMYEGVPARVPYSYTEILMDEYQTKALVITQFEGYEWNRDVKQWITMPEEEDDEGDIEDNAVDKDKPSGKDKLQKSIPENHKSKKEKAEKYKPK